MKWKGWEKIQQTITDPSAPTGFRTVGAIAPVIVSASRSTDIPAFYGAWFIERLKAGYVRWKSPFGGSPIFVSFAKTRLFVFWSKNPASFEAYLETIDLMGYGYYFLYTLNDYAAEGLESHVPPVSDRVETFIRLSRRLGKSRVVWRFDPLLLSDSLSVDDLVDKVRGIGDRIAPYTQRLVFSFVDIAKYPRVRRNLKSAGCPGVREFSESEVSEFCEGLRLLNERWGLIITACAERRNLTQYGIGQGQCISYDLIRKEFFRDAALMTYLHPAGQQTLAGNMPPADPSQWLKDPGQRNTCRCIISKDIGQYSTCMHLCSYCYANSSPALVKRNFANHLAEREGGIFHDTILG